jgi:hypothetical protein
MKKFLVMGLLTSSLAMSGCYEPIPAWQDPNAPLQVSISDYWLQDKLRVTPPQPERFGSGQLRVALQVFNRTDQDLSVDYSYWFTDKAGREIEAPKTRVEVLPPKGYKTFTFESLTAVDDFRVQLRPAR